MRKHKKICTRTDRNFFKKILLLYKDAILVINGKTRTRFTFLKTFREEGQYNSRHVIKHVTLKCLNKVV